MTVPVSGTFASRHIGPRGNEVREMLEAIGTSSLAQLINEVVPADIQLSKPLTLPPAGVAAQVSGVGIRHAAGLLDTTYVDAIGAAMKPEYDAIAAAGFVLQIDCPDLAMARHTGFQELEESEFLKRAAYQVEALNHAVRDIPAYHIGCRLLGTAAA